MDGREARRLLMSINVDVAINMLNINELICWFKLVKLLLMSWSMLATELKQTVVIYN